MQLAHTWLGPTPGEASHVLLFLHGLLGRGANWQSFARRVLERQPSWAAVLVDLRMHGASQGFAPPHSVASAAADLAALLPGLPTRIDRVIAHSLGGKVALRWLGDAISKPSDSGRLPDLWLIDSPPGARGPGEGDDVRRVVQALRQQPPTWSRRQDFVNNLEHAGIESRTALWLSQNLGRTDAGLALTVDLDAIEALLEDHYGTDLWPVVDRLPADSALHLVIGGRSTVFTPRERERAATYAKAGKLTTHVLEHAGHWVHTDDPDGLLDVLASQS